MGIMEQVYISLRDRYLPEYISVVFVLESPPQGHGYFYDTSGRTSEVLFRSFMKLAGINPTTKEDGLQALKKKGWLLVNPVYRPVNKLPDKEADQVILDNYQNFVDDLRELLGDGITSTPIILVKSNIFRLLEKPLVADGFHVINKGLMIPFPLHYHAESFHMKVSSLLHAIKVIK